MFQIQTHGFKELAEAYKKLPDELLTTYVNKGNYEGCKIVMLDAKARAPIHEGPYPPSRSKSMKSFRGSIQLAKELTQKFQAEFPDPIGIEYIKTKRKREAAQRKLAKAIKRTVHKTLGVTGRQIWNRIREAGTLRKSIVIRKQGKPRKDLEIRQIGILNQAYYANWVELGFIHKRGKRTTHVPADPFLRPALYENKEKIINIMREQLKRGLASSAKWKAAA